MKWFELSEAQREGWQKNFDKMLGLLIESLRETGNQLIRYLFLVNSGGAIAILSFMGASDIARRLSISEICLKAFLLGVLFSGGTAICNYFVSLLGISKYSGMLVEVYKGQVEPGTASDRYSKDLKRNFFYILVYVFGGASFICFAAGVTIVLFTPFSSLFAANN
jgi:hypothetical protein